MTGSYSRHVVREGGQRTEDYVYIIPSDPVGWGDGGVGMG